jgi:hypothetical protein
MGTYRRCAVSFPWPRAELTVSPLTTERFAQHPTEIPALELRFHRVSATSDDSSHVEIVIMGFVAFVGLSSLFYRKKARLGFELLV